MTPLSKHEYTNSLHADGHRRVLYPADVKGFFQRIKKLVHPLMVLNFLILPFITIGGDRLLLLDIQNRNFFVFGLSFNAQDIYLLFFLVTGLAFSLFFITALVGRIFCGWACPQTVFLEGLYRPIERWIEGPQTTYFKNQKNKNFIYWRNLGFKFFLYILLSFVIAHFIVLYFVEFEVFSTLWTSGIGSHPVVFGWVLFLTALLTFNYGWFREQLCLIICPYGRLQSVLMDDDSLLIGYDPKRGEPRGKAKDGMAGDCIDCMRCVQVCPTGIDIRNGLQMECIGCANCIDACDEIMHKVGKSKGLIRYDSYHGLAGEKKRVLRPRIYIYGVMLIIGMIVSTTTLSHRESFEANLLRMQGAPYILLEEKIRNQFEIHLFNKDRFARTFTIEPIPVEGVRFTIPISEVSLAKMKDQRIPVFVEVPRQSFKAPFEFTIVVTKDSGQKVQSQAIFAGPEKK